MPQCRARLGDEIKPLLKWRVCECNDVALFGTERKVVYLICVINIFLRGHKSGHVRGSFLSAAARGKIHTFVKI